MMKIALGHAQIIQRIQRIGLSTAILTQPAIEGISNGNFDFRMLFKLVQTETFP
jgi:hypothetical protein